MTSFPFFFFKTQFINVSYGDIYYGHNMDLTIFWNFRKISAYSKMSPFSDSQNIIPFHHHLL